jgi:peptidoglycan hydrolase-like protein with peptidoglycan-binding domain
MKKNIRITEKALSRLIDNVLEEKKVVKEFKVKDIQNIVKEQASRYQLNSQEVFEIQNALNDYFKMKKKPIKIVVDERWGPTTVNALKKFQEMEKMESDGIPGPDVYKRMVELGIRGNFFEKWLSKLGLY